MKLKNTSKYKKSYKRNRLVRWFSSKNSRSKIFVLSVGLVGAVVSSISFASIIDLINGSTFGGYRKAVSLSSAEMNEIKTASNQQLAFILKEGRAKSCPATVIPAAGKSLEHSVRGYSMAAIAIAYAVKAEKYDPVITGVSEQVAISRAECIINKIAAEHVINRGSTGWKSNWQSAFWASDIGLASWALDGRISQGTKTLVNKVVAHEADIVAAAGPRYSFIAADVNFKYGISGDLPVTGDWNGDGLDTVGIYRPSTSIFSLRNSNSGGNGEINVKYGTQGDVPLVGDWDGDGRDTVGIYRPSQSVFSLRNSNTVGSGQLNFKYGVVGDVPLVGDWDGDGKDSVGVYRPSDAAFYLRNSHTAGDGEIILKYGVKGDVPLVGDWDGDGKDSVGVKRGSTILLKSTFHDTEKYQKISLTGSGVPVSGTWSHSAWNSLGLFSNGYWTLKRASVNNVYPLAANSAETANTQGEENSWNALGIAAAIVLKLESPKKLDYLAAFNQFAQAAWSMPSDQQPGWNISKSGKVFNHGFEHPDYVSTVQLLWFAGAMLDNSGIKNHQAFINGTRQYNLVKSYYRPDGTIIYPAAADWGEKRELSYQTTDTFAAFQAIDTAAVWRSMHASKALSRQNQNPNKASFLNCTDKAEMPYPACQEYAAREFAVTLFFIK